MNTILIAILFLTGVLYPIFDGPENKYYHYQWERFYLLREVNDIIDLHNPDYNLMDAALFHATNEIREKNNRSLLTYSPILHRAAILHSAAMIDQGFYDHINTKDINLYDLRTRINASGGTFSTFAENIAEYQLINTGYYYCPIRQKNGVYKYFNCENNSEYSPYTYLEYARRIVKGWLNSPTHKLNLLSNDVLFAGCAARISKDPFKQRQAPYARITQNLGGGKFKNHSVTESENTVQN